MNDAISGSEAKKEVDGMVRIIRAEQFSRKMRERGIHPTVLRQVEPIVDAVAKQGFRAVERFSLRFDKIRITPADIMVSTNEKSEERLTPLQRKALDVAIRNVEIAQRRIAQAALRSIRIKRAWGINYVELKARPIERVGIYIPGGRAPLPSSLIMAGVTARAAGVREIVVCTPPQSGGIAPAILYVAQKLGIRELYRIGGPQAIAAMAYGLPQLAVPKVDMICGPGSQRVAAAKQIVASRAAVKTDLMAGASEILIIADETGNAEYIAADMLAEAEHGENSPAILLTPSEKLADAVRAELRRQLAELPAGSPAPESLRKYGQIVITQNLGEAIGLANTYAAEHVEVFTQDPERIAMQLRNAGAIFIETSKSFCDYGMSYGNHILPTGGTALFLSAFSAYDFVVRSYVERMTIKEQKEAARLTEAFANMEGLPAHARSAAIRDPSRRAEGGDGNV